MKTYTRIKSVKLNLFRLIVIIVLFLNITPILLSQDSDIEVINEFMNNWHLAATQADGKSFFESMDKDAIYIGTDATERWTKKEFEDFAMPYFNKGKAWDFKTIERKVYFSDDKKYAWFNETLNTWMGVCRSSGVLKKHDNNWKIMHYHLSVTVPNNKVKDFIELINLKEKNK
ncbi:MAG: nuclear transport factor 2 family protein [Bacteroidales bacterium]|nr:nuclear transport factor 2 family protein [Bacteroidales bacterium]